jgi:hypothetical protein
MEGFGPLAFGLAIVEKSGELHLVPRRWNAFGLPMPDSLLPHVTAFEHGSDDRFNFDVTIALPLIGRVTSYRGWLVRHSQAADH